MPTHIATLCRAGFLPILVAGLGGFLCSCATTSVKDTWTSPDLREPARSIAVLAVHDQLLVREGLENRLANQLIGAGASAFTTFGQLTLPQIKEDKHKAAEVFASKGAGAVLVLRLVDVGTSYREIQPGGERYAGVVTGFGYGTWYDYYTVGFANISPTYGSLKEFVYLEAALFDLKSGKRMWSAVSKSTLTERSDKLAEVDPLVAKFVAAMRKDGVIP